MSEALTEKYYGVPAWAWVLGSVTVVGGVVVVTYSLLHEYFIEPGEVVLNQYKTILEDIYKETKEFLEQNESEGIYGLTAEQEAILGAKEKAADYLRPQVEKIITERGQMMWGWVEPVIITIVLSLAIPHVADKLIGLIKKWRAENPEASNKVASQYGHGHLILELVANDFAFQGKLGVAGALHNANIPSIYSRFTAPGLNAQISFYNSLLPSLIEGTMAWIVTTHMLSYMTYEISATKGIMGLMWTWWLPPLI